MSTSHPSDQAGAARARREGRASGRPEGDRLGASQLARGGFEDSRRAGQLLTEVLERLAPAGEGEGGSEVDTADLVADLGSSADPDAALLLLVRLLDPRSTGARGERTDALTLPVVRAGGAPRRRLLALLGGSVALGESLLRHPEHIEDVAEGGSPEAWAIVEAVRGQEGRAGADALRVAYRRQLLRVATADLTSDDPVALL
ncbi:MAG: bifunctional glutamine-synthetase adenylyltransferase/deadenyltransferase, partial [Arsenicicoccus sp.]